MAWPDLGQPDHRPRPHIAIGQRRHRARSGGRRPRVRRHDPHVVIDAKIAQAVRPHHAAGQPLLAGQYADALVRLRIEPLLRKVLASPAASGASLSRAAVRYAVVSRRDPRTPPMHSAARSMRLPNTVSFRSCTISRTCIACVNRVSYPVRSARMPTLKRCKAMRLTSAEMTRRYAARSGAFEPRDLLGGHAEGFRMAVRAKRADALRQHDVLIDRALRARIFDAAMNVTRVDVDGADGFAIDVDAEIHRFFERDMNRADGELAGPGNICGHDTPPFILRTLSQSALVLAALTSTEYGMSRSSTAVSMAGSMNRRRGSGWSGTAMEYISIISRSGQSAGRKYGVSEAMEPPARHVGDHRQRVAADIEVVVDLVGRAVQRRAAEGLWGHFFRLGGYSLAFRGFFFLLVLFFRGGQAAARIPSTGARRVRAGPWRRAPAPRRSPGRTTRKRRHAAWPWRSNRSREGAAAPSLASKSTGRRVMVSSPCS